MSRIDGFVYNGLVFVGFMLVMLMVGMGCGLVYIAGTKGICVTRFECAEQTFNECLASERYTRDECLELVGNDQ